MRDPDPAEIPIDGVLDLHTFRPSEVKDLIPQYLSECLRKDIYSIRIIHGKGTGTLRRTVHSILNRIPEVSEFRTAGEDAGGWGATLVTMKKRE